MRKSKILRFSVSRHQEPERETRIETESRGGNINYGRVVILQGNINMTTDVKGC